MLAEQTIQVGSDELLSWATNLDDERLWALEDCRRLTRWLERQLLAAGEELVRVPPKLMAPERRARQEARASRTDRRPRGCPRGPAPTPASAARGPTREPFRELKLLVDHRDAIVNERRRLHQRLRWHLHQLDPTFAVPLRMLERARCGLDASAAGSAGSSRSCRCGSHRELVASCRSLDRVIAELDRSSSGGDG